MIRAFLVAVALLVSAAASANATTISWSEHQLCLGEVPKPGITIPSSGSSAVIRFGNETVTDTVICLGGRLVGATEADTLLNFTFTESDDDHALVLALSDSLVQGKFPSDSERYVPVIGREGWVRPVKIDLADPSFRISFRFAPLRSADFLTITTDDGRILSDTMLIHF